MRDRLESVESGEGEVTEEEVGAEPAIPENLVARARLGTVPNRLSARLIDALLPTEAGGVLLVTSMVRPPRAEIALFRIEGTAVEGVLEPLDEEVLAVGRVRSTRPRLVALPTRGIVMLQSLDFLADAEKERALLQWWVPVEQPIFDGPDVVELPEGLRLGREVSAAAIGNDLVVCFSALIEDEDVEEDAIRRIACGLLDPAEARWIDGPSVIFEAAPENPIAQLDLAGGGEHGAFLIWAAYTGGGWSARGAILTASDGALVVALTGDLAGEQLATEQSSFVWRNTPLASVGPSRVAYYLPQAGEQRARGGQLTMTGERVGPRRQLPSWPQPSEKALLLPHGDDHVMIFDALGREGERSIAIFTEDGISTLDYWSPLDTPEVASMARLGHAENRMVALVHDAGEELPGIVSLFSTADLFARPRTEEDGPAPGVEERRRALREHEEEKLRVARERSEAASESDDSGDGERVEE